MATPPTLRAITDRQPHPKTEQERSAHPEADEE
jgi:hypothetical protein